jgi:predicted AAA+ superfamily ATPase
MRTIDPDVDGHRMERLVHKMEAILDRLEKLLPGQTAETDWNALAWRWQQHHGQGYLQAVTHPHRIRLDALHHLDEQKAKIVRNTEQFVRGLPANNVLLTGARGTGKSSLVKALLTEFASQGLRLVEVDKQDLHALPQIVELIRSRPERFIIFCDDLSFEAGDSGYKALKVVLDGTLAATSDNVLVYATSNRRNLLPEYMSENLETRYVGDEIRPGDSTEEKISLSERFGLWLSFYAFSQDQYLQIAQSWLSAHGVTQWDDEVRLAALQFAQERGMRSGRVAYQFARDYAGRLGLEQSKQK